MSTIWFTSDFHFNHDKDFIYRPRGFSNVVEMNRALLENYNSLVKPEDTVYILGDCCLCDTEASIEILKALNGKKYLAFGNHDTDNRLKRFAQENIFEDIKFGYRLRIGNKTLVLTHYPSLVANPNENWTLNFYGHTHTADRFELFGDSACYNVGVDAHDNCPVCLDEIQADIHKRTLGE